MKDKGFTLIELLAVIVILAIILLIAVPQVLDVIDDVKNNAYISSVELVNNAAELYMASNTDKLPNDIGTTFEIALTDLTGYIDDVSANDNTCSGYLLITKVAEEKFVYSPHINCSGSLITSSVADGLIGHWAFDNVSGSYDLSLNSNHGTGNGGIVVGAASDNNGNLGKATAFDGINDYIEITNDSNLENLGVGYLTIMLWYKSNNDA